MKPYTPILCNKKDFRIISTWMRTFVHVVFFHLFFVLLSILKTCLYKWLFFRNCSLLPSHLSRSHNQSVSAQQTWRNHVLQVNYLNQKEDYWWENLEANQKWFSLVTRPVVTNSDLVLSAFCFVCIKYVSSVIVFCKQRGVSRFLGVFCISLV